MNVYENIENLGITLPPAPKCVGLYSLYSEFGNDLIYTSGFGPNEDGQKEYFGRLGQEFDVEEGKLIARQTAINLLGLLEAVTGDLNRVKRIVKLLVFINSDAAFVRQPDVANGASALFIDVFGEEIGRSARSAIGVAVLPDNIPIEIEMVVELKNSGTEG